jgi:hypothetical protein
MGKRKWGESVFILLMAVLLSACSTPLPTEEELREELNIYRPALRLTYELEHDTRTNNVLALKEILKSPTKDNNRVIVVSHLGNGGGEIAMERAKKAAVLLTDIGVSDPRLYIRHNSSLDKQREQMGMLEIYVVPSEKWSDLTFVEMMKTDSVEIAALGGVLRTDVARLSMNEVFERRVRTVHAPVEEQIESVLMKVGWEVKTVGMPSVIGPPKEYVMSLPENGVARPMEAVSIGQQIAFQAGIRNVKVELDRDNNIILFRHGMTTREDVK